MNVLIRRLVTGVTGLLFAAYAAYFIFILVKDTPRGLPLIGIVTSALLILLFGILAAFAFTAEVVNLRFRMIRRIAAIVDMIIIIVLRIRLAGDVISYINLSQFNTVLYGLSYFMTIAGLVILAAYYRFIRKNLARHPKASKLLPISAAALFLASLAAEVILFLVYNIGLEANMLRTIVSRPIFYLGFAFFSLYFLYPPLPGEIAEYAPPADDELVKPIDESDYKPPEGTENAKPDETFVMADDGEYIPPEGIENAKPDETFIMTDDVENKDEVVENVVIDKSSYVLPSVDEYVPPEGVENLVPDKFSFVMPDDGEYIPPVSSEGFRPDKNSFVMPADGEYIPPLGDENIPPDSSEFIMKDDKKGSRRKKGKNIKPYSTDYIMTTDGKYVPPAADVPVSPDKSDYILNDGKKSSRRKKGKNVKPYNTDYIMPGDEGLK